MNHLLLGTLYLAAASFVIGCANNDENHAPLIRSISANPDVIERRQISEITCLATDDDGDVLTYFWRASSGVLYNQDRTTSWTSPNLDGKYWVSVSVNDGKEVDIDSIEISVTTSNSPPTTPYNPIPADGAINVNDGNSGDIVWLRWYCVDPDGDEVRYFGYFGANPQPPSYGASIYGTEFGVQYLHRNTTYFWRIEAFDGLDTSRSPVWSFTTNP